MSGELRIDIPKIPTDVARKEEVSTETSEAEATTTASTIDQGKDSFIRSGSDTLPRTRVQRPLTPRAGAATIDLGNPSIVKVRTNG